MPIPLPPPADRRSGPRAGSLQQFTARLRTDILERIRMGALEPGARLASIRRLSRESGVDHRVVAQAYRVLEEEGLVRVLGRSGVQAGPRAARVAPRPRDTGAWIAGVLEGAGLSLSPDTIRALSETIWKVELPRDLVR